MIRFSDVIVDVLRLNPPMVPLVAFTTPAFVTLNGADANVACPS